MSSIDIFSMAIKNLFKRKVRTFLTILGVIIGTAAIIIMVSLGIAMNESFDEQINKMGDITIVQVYDPSYWDSSASQKSALDKAKIKEFKNIKGVKAVTPILNSYLYFKIGKYVASFNVNGIDVSVMEDFNYKLESGRLLTESDGNTLNFVFGSEIPYQFEKVGTRRNSYSMEIHDESEERPEPDVDVFNGKIKMSYDYSITEKKPTDSGDNKSKKIKPYSVNCVGLLKSGDWNTDYNAFVSITELEKVMAAQKKYELSQGNRNNNNKKGGYERVLVKCSTIDDVEEVSQQIKDMGFEAYSDIDYLNSMKEMSNSLQMLLGAIGCVSLFIAAIGITNTMIMAIYERTREIGIMKVIGAQIKDIKRLFLLEAILIGFFGGVFGIIISLLVSSALNNVGIPFLNMMSSSEGAKISSIPSWLCICALSFSSFIGLLSGYFPARRAMKLSALTAIKTE